MFDHLIENREWVAGKDPLWKISLNDNEYQELKEYLRSVFLFDQKKFKYAREAALFFAAWWKREYQSGIPSREQVAVSLGIDADLWPELYALAKKGGTILGFKWLKRENTLHFRTLLLQGGLPIAHISQHITAYTKFLLRVLEIEPKTIYDFCDDYEIIKLLPVSCRINDIYECCLQIIRDETALDIIDNQDQLKELKQSIRTSRGLQQLRKSQRKIFSGVSWILRKQQGQHFGIDQVFQFPDRINSEELATIVDDPAHTALSDYHIVINSMVICQLRRSQGGDYRTFWLSRKNQEWDYQSGKPDIYIKTPNNTIFHFPVKGMECPDLTSPTLWVKKEEERWILCQGKNCQQEKAMLIIPAEWEITFSDLPVEYAQIILNQKQYSVCFFEGGLTITNGSESYNFHTNCTAFDWFIQENKPDWILKSDIPVVISFPKIFVYDKTGVPIKQATIKWKAHGSVTWNNYDKYNQVLPLGCIDFRLTVEDISEYGTFFNIGNLSIEYLEAASDSFGLSFTNEKFSFHLNKSPYIDIEQLKGKCTVSVVDQCRFPDKIQLRLFLHGQIKGLVISILPGFSGFRMLDPQQQIVPMNSELIISNLFGFRVLSTGSYVMRAYNAERKDIYFERKIPKGLVSLNEFKDMFIRLIQMADKMDKHNSVIIEFRGPEDDHYRYYLKSFNLLPRRQIEDGRVEITIDEAPETLSLYAIQLDCHPDNIEPVLLERDGQSFILENSITPNFLVFSEDSSEENAILPFFVSTNIKVENNLERINQFIEVLKEECIDHAYWLRVKKYFQKAMYFRIPLNAFDHFRAIALSPKLVTRFFCLAAINTDSPDSFFEICNKFEDELGVSFHWINHDRWEQAIEWAVIKQNDSDRRVIMNLLWDYVEKQVQNNNPLDVFNLMGEFIVKGELKNIDYQVKPRIQALRGSFGVNINELPDGPPSIGPEFMNIIPTVDIDPHLLAIVLSPLTVALSMGKKAERVFSENQKIRRNIQYTAWRFPRWYGDTIIYCLNKTKKQ